MGFEYKYTCFIIDKNMDSLFQDVDDIVKDILDSYDSNDNDGEPINYEEYSNRLCDYFQEYFEEVRKSNYDMRCEADRQIQDLINEMESLQCELDSALDDIENLSRDVENLTLDVGNLTLERDELIQRISE